MSEVYKGKYQDHYSQTTMNRMSEGPAARSYRTHAEVLRVFDEVSQLLRVIEVQKEALNSVVSINSAPLGMMSGIDRCCLMERHAKSALAEAEKIMKE